MTGEQSLIDYVSGQRWFGSKSKTVGHATVIDRAPFRDADPALELQLVEMRFDTGTHEMYQLLRNDGLDALEDPHVARQLVHMIRSEAKLPAEEGIVEFMPFGGFAGDGAGAA